MSDKKTLVGMMNGAVPETDVKWGHFATGFVIGSMIGHELTSLADQYAAERQADLDWRR